MFSHIIVAVAYSLGGKRLVDTIDQSPASFSVTLLKASIT